MIRIMGFTNEGEVHDHLSLNELPNDQYAWFWADFDRPTQDEVSLLTDKFGFHKLAVEDCLHHLPRPKIEFYSDHSFIVVHSLHGEKLLPEEVDLFVSEGYIVTFHMERNDVVDRAMEKVSRKRHSGLSTRYAAFLVIDEMVDDFFPSLLQIEDRLDAIENEAMSSDTVGRIFDRIYDIRADLLKVRRVIYPMRDLLYRIVNSERLELDDESRVHFMDVYDHLLKLSEKIVDDRETTADIIENVNSVLNQRTNEVTLRTNDIVFLLTIISVIFMPLSFIVGLYGMNFIDMPELHWKYGYIYAWTLMIIIVAIMVFVFRKLKWLTWNSNGGGGAKK
ncbi:magnesium/cobalt transporter CorA [Paenibacillus sp. JDR-2]|uniref:magnesium/cobalt transporter CorA n=1 Tax=Paenibacillus sp. (strain JDR-2) TaxID=324057 RepID=UPI0001666B6A|nr:magnesium/cobalt transporter CorA [Paenibacillus sp. JDR-2]ACT03179.1 magnesium and cobalt transport protein CorA [Paenibacillus sp. JDR-2]